AGKRVSYFRYDGEGRQVSVASPEGIVHYEYDPIGRHSRTWTNSTEVENVDIGGTITDGVLQISGTRADGSNHIADSVAFNGNLAALQTAYDQVFGSGIVTVNGTLAHHAVSFSDTAYARVAEASVRIGIQGLVF